MGVIVPRQLYTQEKCNRTIIRCGGGGGDVSILFSSSSLTSKHSCGQKQVRTIEQDAKTQMSQLKPKECNYKAQF